MSLKSRLQWSHFPRGARQIDRLSSIPFPISQHPHRGPKSITIVSRIGLRQSSVALALRLLEVCNAPNTVQPAELHSRCTPFPDHVKCRSPAPFRVASFSSPGVFWIIKGTIITIFFLLLLYLSTYLFIYLSIYLASVLVFYLFFVAISFPITIHNKS